jgi:hypothetical protein
LHFSAQTCYLRLHIEKEGIMKNVLRPAGDGVPHAGTRPFIPVSIGALAGVTERDAGVAAGLVNTSQNFGAAIGVAVASSIAASYSRTLTHHGYATAAALTGGFQRALWVCGLTGLAAIPAAFVLIRRAGRS